MSIADATCSLKTFLVTGGAGSIGSFLVRELLKHGAKKVIAFDIDEHSLAVLSRKINDYRLQAFLGDVKDSSDVERALEGVDIVLHLAAVKMVDVSSYNPLPCIRTNVDGTINMVLGALKEKVSKFLFISSDKAVDFGSVYGATKFIGERLTLWGNFSKYRTFSVCRLGNVIETRGNVFEIWKEQKETGQPLTVTHPDMERYFWHVEEAVAFILKALETMKGGEIFIPKMSLFKVIDLARKISPEIRLIGVRPEELLKARLITDYEKELLKDEGEYWVIRQ